MTNESADNKILENGESFHVLVPLMLRVGHAHAGTRVFEAGEELVVTQEMREVAAEDPKGSWLSLVGDPAGQVARWGAMRFQRGRAATDSNWWSYGDARWESERRAALELVWGMADPKKKADALKQVQRRFERGQGLEAEDDD